MHKQISKRNLAHMHVGMTQCMIMNTLADKVQKQDVPCRHALHKWPWHIIQQPSLHKYVAVTQQLAINLLLLM